MKTYVIAEIGINHNGDMDTTRKLIRLASVSGCDAVKFQKRTPDLCVPEHQKDKLRDTPWGRIKYIDYKKKIEFESPEYDEIDDICFKEGIDWSASPWDIPSVQFLEKYELPWYKIPSAMLTNTALISSIAAKHRKIILSTGMSTVEEIDTAVRQIRDYHNDFVLMHCNSTYPAPLNELNLSCIKTLKERYNCEVGYSGHEFRLGTSVAAIYLGATYIERHITLDRSMWGTDQLGSVEPQGLIKMVKGIRELEEAHGDGVIQLYPGEEEARKKLRR